MVLDPQPSTVPALTTGRRSVMHALGCLVRWIVIVFFSMINDLITNTIHDNSISIYEPWNDFWGHRLKKSERDLKKMKICEIFKFCTIHMTDIPCWGIYLMSSAFVCEILSTYSYENCPHRSSSSPHSSFFYLSFLTWLASLVWHTPLASLLCLPSSTVPSTGLNQRTALLCLCKQSSLLIQPRYKALSMLSQWMDIVCIYRIAIVFR